MDSSDYFYRNVIFSKKEDKISLVDIYKPNTNKQELEPWFGLILQLADGQHTIEELLIHLTNKYNGNPPDNLDKTVQSVIDRLKKSNLIILTENKIKLPYYLSLPLEFLDVDKAKKMLEEDRNQVIDDFNKF